MTLVIDQQFVKNLEAFAKAGYRFDGEHVLYKQSQQEGLLGYLTGMASGQSHGYIELPTGVGKTPLFISLIENYLKAAKGDENSRVLIAVPTEKLAVQTAQAFAKFMPEIARTIEADDDEGKEIDWENSDIGLQYGKAKHAHKKPKVLITTYQSLTRDKENKIYPPNEYGFVIYDEGHVTTAPNFGTAIDKFHDAIQLAVTATPEYSESKTVATRLPHCYYQLPLATAINRGDLCNVRPAFINTKYRVDETLLKEFIEAQHGRKLTEHQLQQLLNHEARNQAVIQTYLRGADPDSGERYFGQNGMVFGTGIKHAEAIADQFRKEMERGDSAILGKWLDTEGIELIATVHGETKGAWLRKGLMTNAKPGSRTYQGNKEWYSEQEIFDLHDKGKILILASVAKLKMGYDSPHDSVLFDLADRYSKVDATQIDGRAFRLDADNPNKTATIFNLRDENSTAIYAEHPEFSPIYCSEVIEGAEFRKPSKRANSRFKKPPPELEKTLEQAGFDVTTNLETLRTISQEYKKQRAAAQHEILRKEDDWLSTGEMRTYYVGENKKFKKLFQQYQQQKITQLIGDGNTEQEATQQVNKLYVGMRIIGSQHPLCASPLALAEMEAQGHLRLVSTKALPKEANWLSSGDMEEHYKGGYSKFKTLFEQYQKQKIASLITQGHTEQEAAQQVDKLYVGMRSFGTSEALCVSPSAFAEMEAEGHFLIAPLKEEDWLSISEMISHYVGRNDKFKPLLNQYRQQKIVEFIAAGETEQEAIQQVNKLYVGMRTVGVHQALCASPLTLSEMEAAGSLLPISKEKPQEDSWLSSTEMSKQYVGDSNKFNVLLEQSQQQKIKQLMGKGKTEQEAAKLVDELYVGMRAGTRSKPVFCASPLLLKEMETEGLLRPLISLASPKEDDWLSGSDMCERYVGTYTKFVALLEKYRQQQIKELMEEGKTEQEVAQQVDALYVGIRTVFNRQTLCASPLTIEALVTSGLLRSIDSKAPPKEADWLSKSQMASLYVGGEVKIKLLLFQYRDEKITALVQQGSMLEVAKKQVDELYVGLRTDAGNNEAICASPSMLMEMEAAGILQRRKVTLTELPANSVLTISTENLHGKVNDASPVAKKGAKK